MSLLADALRRHAAESPNRTAVCDEINEISYRDLLIAVECAALRLRDSSARVLALLADNGSAWIVADLAAHVAGIPIVPLPPFFSAAQIAHAVRSAGVDRILTDQPDRIESALPGASLQAAPFHGELRELVVPMHDAARRLPDDTQKITFTSGTTGEPRGVCLGEPEIEMVARSLELASEARTDDRHLCVLPLATLLENIGGVYTPLLAGATTCAPRLANVGLTGSSTLDVARLCIAMTQWRPTSSIMVPQMLQALVAAAGAGLPLPRTLRHLAVGGAPVSTRLLQSANALGLPVYEGYGLSECASVVAVNRPGQRRDGSVGRPLPHVSVEIAGDGEILVRGIPWRGYLGERSFAYDSDVIATGDLGHLDDDGYLHVTGRKKNIFITSFGRNVAPEWVERELVARPCILQAAVFGEARPFNAAVIVPHPAATREAVASALDDANRELPDYARVQAWIPADEPFSPNNGLSTPNGRLRRTRILGAYAQRIDALYQH